MPHIAAGPGMRAFLSPAWFYCANIKNLLYCFSVAELNSAGPAPVPIPYGVSGCMLHVCLSLPGIPSSCVCELYIRLGSGPSHWKLASACTCEQLGPVPQQGPRFTAFVCLQAGTNIRTNILS